MKNIKNYLVGACATAILLFSACSKELNVAPPSNITDEQIAAILASGDSAKIRLIMGSMANGMPLLFNFSGITTVPSSISYYYNTRGLDVMRSLEGNDMILGDQAGINYLLGTVEYNLGDIQSAGNQLQNYPYWFYAWACITKANQMLNLLPGKVVANNSYLENAKAEGLVMRAYSYSFLMQNYQQAYLQGGQQKPGMPIYTVFTPYQAYKARSSSTDTYNFIKNDLDSAIILMKAAGTGYTPNTADLDLGVANFLLARVSLWTGDWATAISACSDILSHYPNLMTQAEYGGKNTGTPTKPVFLPDNNGFLNNAVDPEVILGFPLGVATTYFTNQMNPFGLGSGGISEGFKRIDDRLYNQIAPGDYRQDNFVGSTPFGNYTYPGGTNVNIPSYTNLKFAATVGLGTDNAVDVGNSTYCVMRSSEVLLMLAEAEAQSGNNDAAKQTLNILLAARTRSGATPLTCDTYPSMTGLSALQMVQLQWRIEMWGEGGEEFYNNKRWGIAVNRTGSGNHLNTTATLSVPQMTLQIPEDEIDNNPKMVQNN